MGRGLRLTVRYPSDTHRRSCDEHDTDVDSASARFVLSARAVRGGLSAIQHHGELRLQLALALGEVHVKHRILQQQFTEAKQLAKAVEQFLQAIRPGTIIGSAAGGLLAYGVFSFLKLPVLFFYGAIGAMGGLIMAALYNLVAKFTGGIEVEIG